MRYTAPAKRQGPELKKFWRNLTEAEKSAVKAFFPAMDSAILQHGEQVTKKPAITFSLESSSQIHGVMYWSAF